MLQFLRNKYPRLSRSLEDGVREGFEQLSALQKDLRKDVRPRAQRDRRRRKSASRAPLSERGFSDDDELDFDEASSSRVFGRQERTGKLGALPGQSAPVTAKLPDSKLAFLGGGDDEVLVIRNATERVVLVRAWVALPDGKRWRGERLPRNDHSRILGDFVRTLSPGESMNWAAPSPDLVLTFHEVGGRPARLHAAHEDAEVVLREVDAVPHVF